MGHELVCGQASGEQSLRFSEKTIQYRLLLLRCMHGILWSPDHLFVSNEKFGCGRKGWNVVEEIVDKLLLNDSAVR